VHKITYKEMAINRPVVIARGLSGHIEVNSINAYVGEWVVFKLPMEDGSEAELRLPVEDALEQGIVISADKIFRDYEYEEEE
jgi:hypothetical protein